MKYWKIAHRMPTDINLLWLVSNWISYKKQRRHYSIGNKLDHCNSTILNQVIWVKFLTVQQVFFFLARFMKDNSSDEMLLNSINKPSNKTQLSGVPSKDYADYKFILSTRAKFSMKTILILQNLMEPSKITCRANNSKFKCPHQLNNNNN